MSRELHSFADSSRFAQRLGQSLGLSARRVHEHHFPDGETLIRIDGSGSKEAILVRSLFKPNEKLIECLLAADALRRSGARRVTLVAPYLPYMRQDSVFHPGEAVSQRVVGALLGNAFDRVFTLEAHLHRIADLNEVVAGRSVSAAPAIAGWLRGRRGVLVVGPDSESAPWIESLASSAGCAGVVGRKQRYADRRVRIHLPPLPPCRVAVIVDDIASSGATIAETARALRAQGIESIEAIVVHAIFSAGAAEKIAAAGVRRVLSCNTVPHPTNRIDCAGLVADIFTDVERKSRR